MTAKARALLETDITEKKADRQTTDQTYSARQIHRRYPA